MQKMLHTAEEKFLVQLAKEYPTVAAASSEIINLQAILRLPKPTEHFMSDLHGESDAFTHILGNASGVIKEKVDRVLAGEMSDAERAEFATLVVKTLNITSNTPADFADAGQSDWFYPYVNAAANAGLIVGYDGYFRPDDRITREEMAVIVAKAYAYAGKEAASGGIDKFTDKETIAQWAYESVDTVTSAGLIAGMTPDTFEASANTTRAQAVAVLRRFLDAIQ